MTRKKLMEWGKVQSIWQCKYNLERNETLWSLPSGNMQRLTCHKEFTNYGIFMDSPVVCIHFPSWSLCSAELKLHFCSQYVPPLTSMKQTPPPHTTNRAQVIEWITQTYEAISLPALLTCIDSQYMFLITCYKSKAGGGRPLECRIPTH